MFASFLRSQKGRKSESTPLLAALDRVRSRNTGDNSDDEDDEYDEIGQYDGGDEDDEDNGGDGRDGPLLPVFSEFLGISRSSPGFFHCSPHPQIACPSTIPRTSFA
jgi:hypothetical protein